MPVPQAKNSKPKSVKQSLNQELLNQPKTNAVTDMAKMFESGLSFTSNNSLDEDFEKTKRRIYIVAAVIIVTAFIGFIIAYRYGSNFTANTAPTNENPYNGVIYLPNDTNAEVALNGKIILNPLAEHEPYKFILMSNADKSTLAYLESQQIDLSLSQGYVVELKGALRSRYNNLSVVDVKSVKLK